MLKGILKFREQPSAFAQLVQEYNKLTTSDTSQGKENKRVTKEQSKEQNKEEEKKKIVNKMLEFISSDSGFTKNFQELEKLQDREDFFINLYLLLLSKDNPYAKDVAKNPSLVLAASNAGYLPLTIEQIEDETILAIIKKDKSNKFLNDNFDDIFAKKALAPLFDDPTMFAKLDTSNRSRYLVKYLDISAVCKNLCTSNNEEFFNECYKTILDRKDFVNYIEPTVKFLEKFSEDNLNKLAKKLPMIVEEPDYTDILCKNTRLFDCLYDQNKVNVLAKYLEFNNGKLPPNFYSDHLYNRLKAADLIDNVLLKKASPESLIDIINNFEKMNVKSFPLSYIVIKKGDPTVTAAYIQYLKKLKNPKEDEIRHIFMLKPSPSKEIVQAVMSNPAAIASLTASDMQTLLMRNKDFREALVDTKEFSSKLQIRFFINLALNNSTFCDYLFNDPKTEGKCAIIDRIKQSATARELLALAVIYPHYVEKFLDKQQLEKFSPNELLCLKNKVKVSGPLLELVGQELLKENKVETSKNKMEVVSDISDIDLSQGKIIKHVNSLYKAQTKDSEPLLNDGSEGVKSRKKDVGGVCAGLVTEWIRKMSRPPSEEKYVNGCKKFNEKLAGILKSKNLSEGSFLYRVNNSHTKTNVIEAKDAITNKKSITIEKNELLSAPKNELNNFLEKLSENVDCYVHISTPGHVMGIVVNINPETKEKEVSFYDPNSSEGAIHYKGSTLEQASFLIINHINQHYNKQNTNLELDLRTYKPEIYEKQSTFSIKQKL